MKNAWSNWARIAVYCLPIFIKTLNRPNTFKGKWPINISVINCCNDLPFFCQNYRHAHFIGQVFSSYGTLVFHLQKRWSYTLIWFQMSKFTNQYKGTPSSFHFYARLYNVIKCIIIVKEGAKCTPKSHRLLNLLMCNQTCIPRWQFGSKDVHIYMFSIHNWNL